VFSDGGFNKFVVVAKDFNPLLGGIAVNNAVKFKGDDGMDHTGQVDAVDAGSFTVRFDLSDTHKPATDATESITVSRNASLQDSVLGPLSKLTNPLNLTTRIPTIQDLVGELADVTGIDALKDVKLSSAGDSIELPINFSLDPVKFTDHLDLGTSIAGLKLS